jgi:voltage-gated potassium channel
MRRGRVRELIRSDTLTADIVTLMLSYAFILVSAWNDDLLGLPPNVFTLVGEYLLAAGLAVEIVLRLIIVEDRAWYFYPLVVIDAISVLTVIPGLVFVTFARVVRLLVSGTRMLRIIDKLSRAHGNPYIILLVYPLVVPIAAALFFLFERHAPGTQVHNYFQALVLMMNYSLTVGLASNHPVTMEGKVIAGIMLLTGFMCVSIIGNALSTRYTIVRSESVKTKEQETRKHHSAGEEL